MIDDGLRRRYLGILVLHAINDVQHIWYAGKSAHDMPAAQVSACLDCDTVLSQHFLLLSTSPLLSLPFLESWPQDSSSHAHRYSLLSASIVPAQVTCPAILFLGILDMNSRKSFTLFFNFVAEDHFFFYTPSTEKTKLGSCTSQESVSKCLSFSSSVFETALLYINQLISYLWFQYGSNMHLRRRP